MLCNGRTNERSHTASTHFGKSKLTTKRSGPGPDENSAAPVLRFEVTGIQATVPHVPVALDDMATEKPAGGFDGDAYLSRIADRERPWPADSAFLLPSRPAPAAPDSNPTKKPFTMPKPLSKGELQQLKDTYYESIKAAATQTFSEFGPDSITEVVPNKAYVFGPILSKQECEDIFARGQAHGLTASKLGEGAGPRTSLRTNDFMCEPISILVKERIPEEVLVLIESSPPYTCVRGIHPNWRVAKYTAGTAFAAHIDNSDQLSLQKGEEVEKLLSSHTLLIGLADQSAFAGGATRFFPQGTYEHDTVDVFLPQGYAVVFEQKGLLHAGLEVHEGEKYIAQAGVLRAQSDRRFAPAVFKVGLGLDA